MADDRYLEALREIARIAGSLLGADGSPDGEPASEAGDDQACRVMALPYRLQDKAAEVAARENPVNAPNRELMSLSGASIDVLALTVSTGKYWGPVSKKLSVSFLESTPADLRARIVSHLNAWSEWCGISFAETSGTGNVRISRGPGGYWSYLGTDIRLIPLNRPTMNLQGFTMRTADSEFVRVVRHEAGHTLGFPHEHMRKALVDRIDPEKAYAYFQRTQGWSRPMVDQQVLTALDGWSIFGTEPDQDSIMCYQLPGSITRDGQPIRGGRDINRTDSAFAGVIYPKVLRGLDETGIVDVEETADAGPNFVTDGVPDWAPEDDVVLAV